MTVDLARLALGGAPNDAESTRALYWRGRAIPDGAGGLTVPAGECLDLGTWFNAAPVGWWRNLFAIARVRLSVRGSGLLTVRSHGASGTRPVTTVQLDGEFVTDLPVLSTSVDWYWLELRAIDGDGELRGVRWSVDDGPGTEAAEVGDAAGRGAADPGPAVPGSTCLTVVVPTFRREQDALDQVRRLLADALRGVVARVVLVDQGRSVRAASGAAQVLSEAGERFLLIEQDNLGGSGGYARGMLESLAFGSDAVLLLDDDARIESEGLRRMLALSGAAVAAGSPTILGTPLFSAEQPTSLEALAEGVRRRDFRWGPSDGLTSPFDVAVTAPDGWSFADAAAPTDYSGWWGTLLPAGTVAELGLPAPYFLKWDDAEYGLRATRAGFRVRTVPGTGAWHPTWAAKGTISSWSAWPLHRNRLATAAAYGASRGVLLDSLVHQIKHVLSLQYDTADLWDGALAQFGTGPGWLTHDLRKTRDRAQVVLDRAAQSASPAVAGRAAAGQAVTDQAANLPVRGQAVTGQTLAHPGANRPVRRLGDAVPVRAARAVLGLVLPSRQRDGVRVAPAAFTWRDGLGRDVVVLDGTDRMLVRDPTRARRALVRTVRRHLLVARRWPALQRAYAEALPASSTADQWRTVIAGP